MDLCSISDDVCVCVCHGTRPLLRLQDLTEYDLLVWLQFANWLFLSVCFVGSVVSNGPCVCVCGSQPIAYGIVRRFDPGFQFFGCVFIHSVIGCLCVWSDVLSIAFTFSLRSQGMKSY